VTVTVRNIGTGTMPVEIAATAGERWGKGSARPGPGAASAAVGDSNASGAYREARGTVPLAAGEARTLTLHCDFKPERVVVDPDVRILQLRRKLATATP